MLTSMFFQFAAQHLPLAEGIILVLHVLGFFAFLILFWTMAERSPAKEVFTTWTDGGEWGSLGTSALVGLATPLWCFIGPDHRASREKTVARARPIGYREGASDSRRVRPQGR